MSLKDNYAKFREELRERAKHIHMIFSYNDACDVLDYHLIAGRAAAKIRINQWSEFDYIDGKFIEKFKENAHLYLDYYEEYGEHEEHMSIQIPTEMIDSDYTDEMIINWWKEYSLNQYKIKCNHAVNDLFYHIKNNQELSKTILESADMNEFVYNPPEEYHQKVIKDFEDIWTNHKRKIIDLHSLDDE